MRRNQLENTCPLVQACTAFEKLTENYLSKAEKGVFSFFKKRSCCMKIAKTTSKLIDKTTAYMNFPDILFVTQISLLEKLASLFKQLNKSVENDQLNSQTVNFRNEFASALKLTVYAIMSGDFKCSDEVNLHYLEYYLEVASIGLPCPTKYMILKNEILDELSNYMRIKPNQIDQQIICLFETIKYDKNGINKSVNNDFEKFLNLVKFIDAFLLMLKDQQDKILFPKLIKIMNRAIDNNRQSCCDEPTQSKNTLILNKCA